MSQSPTVITNDVPIRINQALVQGIDAIATTRQVKVETLINEILTHYIASQRHVRQDGAKFLLSLAGMFNSGTSNTSENVHSIVTDLVLQKHKEKIK